MRARARMMHAQVRKRAHWPRVPTLRFLKIAGTSSAGGGALVVVGADALG
jgi:hypothetical protein